MSVSSTLFLLFFSYSFSLSTHCYIFLVLRSTISMSLSLYLASFVLVKDWLQGHSNACSITGSYSQRDPVLSLMLCCYCSETLSNFWAKGLVFPFCNGLLQIMWLVLLVPCILRLYGTHFSYELLADDLLDFLDKPFHHLYESLFQGFPGGSAGKESTCSVGDLSSIPGLGRSPGEGKDYPLSSFLVWRIPWATVHGVTKSQTQLRDFHFSTASTT